ncbi:hydrolase, alpha/beta fold family protein, putative [Ectocarpus siliculosus]|uniref:Hydrolase, alpha/beta fold family protein, putative n=1 Tax=Ectocarpus siliculosus TaxID=2880 RepID=D7G6S5_ECTSI|nr:hydrolase, alpha/beta fold family protein, putative [Ectocarpus siliculosus]|eukprot:CBJ27619.1 hydrolase, alpha/beta fold family protein, putative [Ectocarpus siliculosus]
MPPEDLEDGYFERPTPLLLVAGEGQPAAWWKDTTSFFASRGCTVGTMALTGRGSSPTDTLTLRALQAGVAAAVDQSGLTPPVIMAHSMAGFVCQQYLQSYSASGLVLLESFPPSPGALANEHLLRARAGDPGEPNDHVAGPSASLGAQELAQLMKDDPAHWEGLLRCANTDGRLLGNSAIQTESCGCFWTDSVCTCTANMQD